MVIFDLSLMVTVPPVCTVIPVPILLLPSLEDPQAPTSGSLVSGCSPSLPIAVHRQQRTILPTVTPAVRVSGWGCHLNHSTLPEKQSQSQNRSS